MTYAPPVILTVVEHMASCPLDRFEGWLTEAPGAEALTLRMVRPWAGEAVPAVSRCGDGLVVLGGESDAYDDEGTPWLPATRALLADAVRTGLPTLGICLGAQLLAVAIGGHVTVGAPAGTEAGVVDVVARPEALRDPLLGPLAAARGAGAGDLLVGMPSMHSDAVVDLPPGAVWLASSAMYAYQAFRVGASAWGVQFHPEVSQGTFAAWALDLDETRRQDAVQELVDRWDEVTAGGRSVAEAFVQVMIRASALRR